MTSNMECCVPTCPGPGRILYRFPIPDMESSTFKEWVQRINVPWMQSLPEIRIYSKYRVCDLHFTNQSRHKDKTRLKKGSLPTLFLPGFNQGAEMNPEEEQNQEHYWKFKSLKSFNKKLKEFKEICRICFKSHNEEDVVKLYGDDKEVKTILNMIVEVLPDLDHGLFLNMVICVKCKEHLAISYELKKTWQSTEDKLRELVPFAINGEDFVIFEEKRTKFEYNDHNYARKVREIAPDDSYNENYFKQLQKQIHRLGKGPHLCDVCGRLYTEKEAFQNHKRRHMSPQYKPTKPMCEICGSICSSMQDLHRHKYRKHIRTYKCDICNEIFKIKHQLFVHKRLEHFTRKYFQCHFCGKRIRDRKFLESHLKSHESQKQFSCDMCDKVFLKKHTLKKHVACTHVGLKCPSCGKFFGQKRFLEMHAKECQKQGILCNVCNEKFWKKCELDNHRIMAHGLGPQWNKF
ncbi:zinc finger protein 510-like [Tribolium madens]|uniref:zinc finger protein 510-like n=1 Tax=Tribolium madens TaxID=41895 RepID=UPI001CF72280|nr:zinc finger protein 510-like [Tribolium madens]